MSIFDNVQVASLTDIIVLLVAAALVIVSIICVIVAGTTRIPEILARALVGLGIDILIFQGAIDAGSARVMQRPPVSIIGRTMRSMSWAAEVVVLIAMLGVVTYRLYRLIQTVHSRITIFSVGEALDKLPTGIIFAGLTGQVLQANETMAKLNLKLTEDSLLNAEEFWQKISTGDLTEGNIAHPGEKPIVTMADGRTWIFSREKLSSKVGDFYQILAVNVTEEQALTDEYAENVRRLERMNRRLRDYNRIVDETVRKEELLEAKKRVHDNMGTTLLAAKMYIANEVSPIGPEEVMDQWRRDVALLREEAQGDDPEDPIQRFRAAAEYLGLELHFMGELPRDYEAADLIATGIQECMTNAVQHAHATQMYVTVTETMDEITASFSDNGAGGFSANFIEGGGLGLLRRSAEKIGATMEYIPGAHFHMNLHIPYNK